MKLEQGEHTRFISEDIGEFADSDEQTDTNTERWSKRTLQLINIGRNETYS
jgi:hypothetical protein